MASESRPVGSRVAAVLLAAALPLCFAAWLVWQSFHGPQNPARGSFPAIGSSAGPSAGQEATGRDSAGQPGRDGEENGGGGGDRAGGGSSTADKDQDGSRNGEPDSRRPLSGTVVVLDPGHNTANRHHPEEINRLVDAGTIRKACDTTGTATDNGYPEAEFTLDVARRAEKILRDRGATVKLTHAGDREWGPCIDERARIGNEAGADAAVSIHADGSAPRNRGFHIIVPGEVRSGNADTTAITGPSLWLGEQLKKHFADATGAPPANYVGGGSGLTVRKDLGGLNLSTVPKVFVECGNMRNSAEADKLRTAEWRQRAAEGIADGVSAFLQKDREKER